MLLRRMMYAIELRQPSLRVRTLVWARQLTRHGIESSDEEARALARDYDVSPGVVAGATAAARLIEGDGLAAVRRGVHGLYKLLHGERPLQRAPAEFDPGLISYNIDPMDLSERFASLGKQRVSLCLSGPPGAGKSAFVRHLAERAELEVSHKRASDLLSMWLGGTEAAIAEAFAEAREGRLFLVFDEAESLLADRRSAGRSWELSQVNEMLTWMESHPLPFPGHAWNTAYWACCARPSRRAGAWNSTTSPRAGASAADSGWTPTRCCTATVHLVGYSDWSDEPRLWRLANVSNARITTTRFERDPQFDLQAYAERAFGTFQEPPIDVVLRFDADAARDAEAFVFHPSQTTTKNDDGSLTIEFTAGGLDEMCWHLFTWGRSVTVDRPEQLRERLRDMCASLARHHVSSAPTTDPSISTNR